MGSDQDAQAAISALNGAEVDGRSLTVNEARPRESRGGGGGYGGGGGARPPVLTAAVAAAVVASAAAVRGRGGRRYYAACESGSPGMNFSAAGGRSSSAAFSFSVSANSPGPGHPGGGVQRACVVFLGPLQAGGLAVERYRKECVQTRTPCRMPPLTNPRGLQSER